MTPAKKRAASKKPAAKKAAPKPRKAVAKKAATQRAEAPRAPVSLVTGACGFMGSHMVEVLKAAGHEVRATDLADACAKDDLKRGRYPGVLRRLGVEPIPADLTRPHTLEGLADDVDYVFHIAGLFSYSASWAALTAVNVSGTRNLLQQLRRKAPNLKRAIVWGAGGVYGFRDREGVPIREDDSPEPPNDYLRSKWREEWLVMEAGRQEGLKWSILRPTTVYGPRCVYGAGQLLLGAARMRVPIVMKNFTARIPFVHVVDVCRAALHIATSPDAENQIFNLNDDSRMTNIEFFKFVGALEGRSTVELPALVPMAAIRRFAVGLAKSLDAVARLAGKRSPLEADSADYVGRDILYSNRKLKDVGFEFTYPDAREGIRDTIAWYHEEGWL
jgi:nucleoside-diphosphate-sugar epimerase